MHEFGETPTIYVAYTWEFCRSCGGAGWVGARVDHRHPGCGHRCILCDPPPGYDRTYAVASTNPVPLADGSDLAHPSGKWPQTTESTDDR